MINVADIRAITEAARCKSIIAEIEESIKRVAHQGYSTYSMQIEVPKSEIDTIREYFRSSGFYCDYRLYSVNRQTGVTIYTITVRW